MLYVEHLAEEEEDEVVEWSHRRRPIPGVA